MAEIIRCNNAEQYKLAVNSINGKSKYPSIVNRSFEKLLSILDCEKIEYILNDFNISNSEEEEIDLLEAIKKHNNQSNSSNVAISFRTQTMYSWIALHHGKLSGCQVYIVENVNDLLVQLEKNNWKTITIVIDHKSLSINDISKIQCHQSDVGYKYSYGLLTGRDFCSTINLIIKNDLFKKNSLDSYVHINRLNMFEEDIICEDEIRVYPSKRSGLDDLEKVLTSKPINMLSLTGHGRDHIFWLADSGAICGKSMHVEKNLDEDPFGKPSCAYTDECFEQGTRILKAHDILARHIFAYSCFSSKIEEGIFNDNYNLVHAFLDGHPVSYLGTSFVVDGHEALSYYYSAQAVSGISLGVAAANISKFFHEHHFGHQMSFFLIGDPTFKFKKLQSIKTIELQLSDLSFGGKIKNEYELENDTSLIRFIIDDEQFANKFDRFEYRVQLRSENNKDIYGITHTEKNVTILDVFSKTTIKKGLIELSIEYREGFQSSVVRNFDYILGVGLYPNSKFKSYLLESKDSALSLAKSYKFKSNLISNMNQIYKKVNIINDFVDKLSQMVVNYLVSTTYNKGFSWTDQCMENGLSFKAHKKTYENTCPNCERELYILEYEHEFYNEMKREYMCCSKCGIIQDLPHQNHSLELHYKGHKSVEVGSPYKPTLTVKNKSDKNIKVYIGMSFYEGFEKGVEYLSDQDVIILQLIPGEETEVSCEIFIPHYIMPHTYWIHSILMLNGEIWSCKNDLWVTPKVKVDSIS